MNCSYLDSGIRGASAQFAQSMVGESILDKDSFLEMFRSLQSRTLLVTIRHLLYPITEKELHQVFSPHGPLQKIEMVPNKFEVQAQVQFMFSSHANSATQLLQGRNIYNGCCKLEIYLMNDIDECSVTGDHESHTSPALFDEKSENLTGKIHVVTETLTAFKDELHTNLLSEDSVVAELEVNKVEGQCQEQNAQDITPQLCQIEALNEAYSTKFQNNLLSQTVAGCVKEVFDTMPEWETLDFECGKSVCNLDAHLLLDQMPIRKSCLFDVLFVMKDHHGVLLTNFDELLAKKPTSSCGIRANNSATAMVMNFLMIFFDPGGIPKKVFRNSRLFVYAIKFDARHINLLADVDKEQEEALEDPESEIAAVSLYPDDKLEVNISCLDFNATAIHTKIEPSIFVVGICEQLREVENALRVLEEMPKLSINRIETSKILVSIIVHDPGGNNQVFDVSESGNTRQHKIPQIFIKSGGIFKHVEFAQKYVCNDSVDAAKGVAAMVLKYSLVLFDPGGMDKRPYRENMLDLKVLDEMLKLVNKHASCEKGVGIIGINIKYSVVKLMVCTFKSLKEIKSWHSSYLYSSFLRKNIAYNGITIMIFGDDMKCIKWGWCIDGENAKGAINMKVSLNFQAAHNLIFTWMNGQFGGDLIFERLDRILVHGKWRDKFPEAVVIQKVFEGSDHAPIPSVINMHTYVFEHHVIHGYATNKSAAIFWASLYISEITFVHFVFDPGGVLIGRFIKYPILEGKDHFKRKGLSRHGLFGILWVLVNK